MADCCSNVDQCKTDRADRHVARCFRSQLVLVSNPHLNGALCAGPATVTSESGFDNKRNEFLQQHA